MKFIYPFLYFNNITIKPILIIGLIILSLLSLYVVIQRKYAITKSTSKSNILILVALYMSILIYLYLSSSDNLMSGFFEPVISTYLQFEVLIGLSVFVLYLYGILLIQSNLHTYLNLINVLFLVVMNVSLFLSFLAREILLSNNILLVVFCFSISVILNLLKFSKETHLSNSTNNVNFYKAIHKFDDLFLENKNHAEKIAQIIELTTEEICICVSGKWGAGKTSVINGAIDKIESRKNKKSNNLYIRINALEIDDFNGLFIYFYDNVKSYLREKGVYTGIESEYKRFLSSCARHIFDSSFFDFMNFNLSITNHKDYRKNKRDFDKLLSEVLGEEKIVVIVDDIERCNCEKIKLFVFFVKEIASFSGCISIFATDYDVMVKTCNLGEMDNEFFDKFFNYRINISRTDPSEIVQYYCEKLNLSIGENMKHYFNPANTIEYLQDKFTKNIDEELEKIKKSDSVSSNNKTAKLDLLKTNKSKFDSNLSNPRKLGKIFSTYHNRVNILREQYKSLSYDTLNIYLVERQIDISLFLISYIEICHPTIYNDILEYGIFEYLSMVNSKLNGAVKQLNSSENFDDEITLFAVVCDGILYEKSAHGLNYSYLQIEAQNFIHYLIIDYSELKNLVTGFTTIEQKYYEEIDKGLLEKYDEKDVETIIKIVVDQYKPNKERETQRRLNTLLSELYARNVSIDFFFNEGYAKSVSEDLYIMEIIYNTYFNNIDTIKVSDTLLKSVELFTRFYFYGRFKMIKNLLVFFNSSEEKYIDDMHEQFWFAENDLDHLMNNFCSKTGKFFNLEYNSEDVQMNLMSLTNAIKEKVLKTGLIQLDDFKNHIKKMEKSVQDIFCFLKIRKIILEKDQLITGKKPSNISEDNIGDWINYFNYIIDQGEMTYEFIHILSKFFDTIDSKSDSYLKEEHYRDLNKILSKWYKISPIGILKFRKILYRLFDMNYRVDDYKNYLK